MGAVDYGTLGSTESFSSGGINSLTITGNWLNISFSADGNGADSYYYIYIGAPIMVTNRTELSPNTSCTGMYISYFGNNVLRSDYKTGGIGIKTDGYCQNLLYFDNPYYGNIQLLPMITYIPDNESIGYFYNASSGASYVKNNSIQYIYDSITSTWYIVPASICTNTAIIGSVQTLQYNPTAGGNGTGGVVPISLSSLSGICTYADITRVLSCSGTDASGTLTNLYLSGYKEGNTTDICVKTVAGSTGTLTCTLPAVNGTYNAYFYGQDANQLNYLIDSKTVLIGSGTTNYGRDGYIVLILLVGVVSMLFFGNIAVSMALGVFALFVGVGIGIIPADGNTTIAIMLGICGLALAYKMRV
jgi:hypothetical protein